RGALRRDLELMQVDLMALSTVQHRHGPVVAVDDDVLTEAVDRPVAEVETASPPGQDRLTPIALKLEVKRHAVAVRVKPDHLAAAVQDQRPSLARAIGR